MSNRKSIKIITAGDTSVGKTALLRRFMDNSFSKKSKETIGVDFFLKVLELDDESCYLQIWDFGGGDRFRHLLGSYILGAKGALLLFDITRPKTLDRIDDWVSLLRKGDSNLPILLVGTKSDLEKEVNFQDDDFYKIQENYDLFEFIKVSSKTGEHVKDVFDVLLRKILRKDYKHLVRKKQDLNYIIDSLINYSTSGYFCIQVEEIFNYLKSEYNIELNFDQLAEIVENKLDNVSIGMNVLNDPIDTIANSVVVPWNYVVFYLNDKLRRIPKYQHDRLFYKDIRNVLFFPDHTFVGFKKASKLLIKLKYILEECNYRGYFLRNISLTDDSIEIPVSDDNNLLMNIQRLKKLTDSKFKSYKQSYLPDIYDFLIEFKETVDERLIFLIHSHRDKLLPELIEARSITYDDWDTMKETYDKWRTLWLKLKKGFKLRKILVLTFNCDDCESSYRFIYFEKTKFLKIAQTLLKIAPWINNVINDIVSGSNISIMIDRKPKTREFTSSHIQNNLLPDEITFLYQTLVGIENETSLRLSDTFFFNPKEVKLIVRIVNLKNKNNEAVLLFC